MCEVNADLWRDVEMAMQVQESLPGGEGTLTILRNLRLVPPMGDVPSWDTTFDAYLTCQRIGQLVLDGWVPGTAHSTLLTRFRDALGINSPNKI
jgi:hypothetical protein